MKLRSIDGVLHLAGSIVLSLVFLSFSSVSVAQESSSEIFSENFADPVLQPWKSFSKITPVDWVKGVRPGGTTEARWLFKSHGARRISVDNVDNTQGYAIRYADTGITTGIGVLGTLASNTRYQLSFDVTKDPDSAFAASGGNFAVELVAYPVTMRLDRRANVLFSEENPSDPNYFSGISVLARFEGTASDDWSSESFELVSDSTSVDIDASVGKDLAIRITGRRSEGLGGGWGNHGGVIFDNIKIEEQAIAVFDPDLISPINQQLIDQLQVLSEHIASPNLTNDEIKTIVDELGTTYAHIELAPESINALFTLVQTYEDAEGALFTPENHRSTEWWDENRDTSAYQVVTDIHWAVGEAMQYVLDRAYASRYLGSAESVLNGKKFASADFFPGAVEPPAEPTVHIAKIEPNYVIAVNDGVDATVGKGDQLDNFPARKPTGTYLAPGSLVHMTVPAALVGSGYQVRVGGHSRDLSNAKFKRRLDRISTVYPIEQEQFLVANPMGGNIYIEVPVGADLGLEFVEVTIKDAVRSAYFSKKSFHHTSAGDWATESLHSAPWADFQSEKFMMLLPVQWLDDIADPEQVMQHYDDAMDIINDLMGQPRDRGKETMFATVDLRRPTSNYAPGYPSANVDFDPANPHGSNKYLARGPESAPTYFFHERGHAFTFAKPDVERESSIDLLHLAVMTQMYGKDLEAEVRRVYSGGIAGFRSFDSTAVEWMTSFNFADCINMQEGEMSYQAKGALKYLEVVKMLGSPDDGYRTGWQALGRVHRSFVDEIALGNAGESPDADLDIVDKMIYRLSKEVQADLRPLFHFWGMPPQDAVELESLMQGIWRSAYVEQRLNHYRSLIPADNAQFQVFAQNWWGGIPNAGAAWTQSEHARQYDATNHWEPRQKYYRGIHPDRTDGEIYNGVRALQLRSRIDWLFERYYGNTTASDLRFSACGNLQEVNWTARASVNSQDAGLAIDPYDSTSYATFVPQSAGFWFEVDFSEPTTFSFLDLKTAYIKPPKPNVTIDSHGIIITETDIDSYALTHGITDLELIGRVKALLQPWTDSSGVATTAVLAVDKLDHPRKFKILAAEHAVSDAEWLNPDSALVEEIYNNTGDRIYQTLDALFDREGGEHRVPNLMRLHFENPIEDKQFLRIVLTDGANEAAEDRYWWTIRDLNISVQQITPTHNAWDWIGERFAVPTGVDPVPENDLYLYRSIDRNSPPPSGYGDYAEAKCEAGKVVKEIITRTTSLTGIDDELVIGLELRCGTDTFAGENSIEFGVHKDSFAAINHSSASCAFSPEDHVVGLEGIRNTHEGTEFFEGNLRSLCTITMSLPEEEDGHFSRSCGAGEVMNGVRAQVRQNEHFHGLPHFTEFTPHCMPEADIAEERENWAENVDFHPNKGVQDHNEGPDVGPSTPFRCPEDQFLVGVDQAIMRNISDSSFDFKTQGIGAIRFVCAGILADGSLTEYVYQEDVANWYPHWYVGQVEVSDAYDRPWLSSSDRPPSNGLSPLETREARCDGFTTGYWSTSLGSVRTNELRLWCDSNTESLVDTVAEISEVLLPGYEITFLECPENQYVVGGRPFFNHATEMLTHISLTCGALGEREPDDPPGLTQRRATRESVSECFGTGDAGDHDCVNLGYRRDTSGVRSDVTDNYAGWMFFAVDGFSSNDPESSHQARVGLDGMQGYRLELDLGKTYSDIEELEIVSHEDPAKPPVLVDVCYWSDGSAKTCIQSQQINNPESLIIHFDSGPFEARYIDITGSTKFTIDELLVLAADPFKGYRETPSDCIDDGTCVIDTLDKLVDAVEQYWGGDLDLIQTVSGLEGSSHAIAITTVNSADNAEVDIDFNFILPAGGNISAKLLTIGSVSGAYELVVVSDLPSNKQTWDEILGVGVWPDASTNSLDATENNSKIIIPLSGTKGTSEDSGSFTVKNLHSEKLKSALNITSDFELILERGINLFTKLPSSRLPEAAQSLLGGGDVLFFGELGFKSFDWFSAASWAIPDEFSLTSIIPLNLDLGGSDLGLDLQEAAIRMSISSGELVLSLHSLGELKLRDGGPKIKAGVTTFFGSDTSGYSLEAHTTESWDNPFGFSGSSISSASVQYLSFTNQSTFSTQGDLRLSDGTELDLAFSRTNQLVGTGSEYYSSVSLKAKDISSATTSSELKSVLDSVSGSAVTIPNWLSGVGIEELSGTVSWSSGSTTDYLFFANVKVCVDYDNHVLQEVISCDDADLVETKLTVEYVDGHFAFSVEVDFTSGVSAFSHELLPEGYSVTDAHLYIARSNGSSQARVNGRLERESSVPNVHNVASIEFSLNVESGGPASEFGGSFIYELEEDAGTSCDGLIQILETHDDTFSSSSCNSKVPAKNSGQLAHTGFSLSRFSIEFESVALTGSDRSYLALVAASGKYTFANDHEDELQAFIGVSDTGFAAFFDAQASGNISELVGMGGDLNGGASSASEAPTAEISTLITSNIGGELLARVNDVISDTKLKEATASPEVSFNVALSGQAPTKIREHLHFLGIHENLEIDMHLELSNSRADFEIDLETINCEYATMDSNCAGFEDDPGSNEYPDWFKSAEVTLDFKVNRAGGENDLSVFIGGDWAIHENEESPKTGVSQDIELLVQAGFTATLSAPTPEVFICAQLKSMNTSTQLGKPTSLVSAATCSLSNDNNSDFFPLHGLNKMYLRNVGVAVRVNPEYVIFEAAGDIGIEKSVSSTGSPQTDIDNLLIVELKKLAFSINTETAAPLGGEIDAQTNATLSTHELIGVFNHHSDSSFSLNDSDVSNKQHLFHDLRMVGLINDELPPIDMCNQDLSVNPAVCNGITELDVAFGDIGNKFTFGTGFQIEDGSGSGTYKNLGAVDLRLSLNEIHFFGELYLEPLLGKHFTRVDEHGVRMSLVEELRVDVSESEFAVSGSIEIPKPHLFGNLHLFSNHKGGSFTDANCVKSGETLNNNDDAFTAFNKTVPEPNANCHHRNDHDNGTGKPQELYFIRGNLKVNRNTVAAEGVLDDFECYYDDDEFADTDCDLENEITVSMGIKKVHTILGITLELPYIHIKNENPIVKNDSEFASFSDNFNQKIVSNSIDFDGNQSSELTYFNVPVGAVNNVNNNVISQAFGDLNGDGKTDSLVLAKRLIDEDITEFFLVYHLGGGTGWKTMSSDAVKFNNALPSQPGTYEFPGIQAGDYGLTNAPLHRSIGDFLIGDVHSDNGEELVITAGTDGRYLIVCGGVATSNPVCELVHDFSTTQRRAFLIDTDGDGIKSIVAPEISSNATTQNTLSINWDSTSSTWVNQSRMSSGFPQLDMSMPGLVGAIGKFDRSSEAEQLLVFENQSITYHWVLYTCEQLSADGFCQTWGRSLIRKASDDPRGFYFGDFDGDGSDDVLNLISEESDGMISYSGEISSGARAHWTVSTEVDNVVNGLWSNSISGTIRHEDGVPLDCLGAGSLGKRRTITAGKGRNSGTLTEATALGCVISR